MPDNDTKLFSFVVRRKRNKRFWIVVGSKTYFFSGCAMSELIFYDDERALLLAIAEKSRRVRILQKLRDRRVSSAIIALNALELELDHLIAQYETFFQTSGFEGFERVPFALDRNGGGQ